MAVEIVRGLSRPALSLLLLMVLMGCWEPRRQPSLVSGCRYIQFMLLKQCCGT